MGCDIHMYVEYRKKGKRTWRSFGGRITPCRWYAMFEKLAGVRGDESKAIVSPRGYPDDAGWEAQSANELWIDYEAKDDESVAESHARAVDALRWVQSGSSKLVGPLTEIVTSDEILPETDDGIVLDVPDVKAALRGAQRVTCPDWHSHSWLTTEEFGRAIRAVAKPSQAQQYYALLAAMRQLEVGGNEARVVFWFDS